VEDEMTAGSFALDALDIRLLGVLDAHPRAGVLQLSRLTRVARATVSARMNRLEAAGVVTGYGPQINLSAAGYPVQAFVTLEIAQGRLDDVTGHLTELHGVLEAYATTGVGDVLCKVAATSHEDLQATLLELNRFPGIRRSTSVMILSTAVTPRTLPLLASGVRADRQRARPTRDEASDP
jgi:DNA-binding Lrp family transcriptional regulator